MCGRKVDKIHVATREEKPIKTQISEILLISRERFCNCILVKVLILGRSTL